MDLQNITVLITGGTSGIGLELVKQLTKLGAKIIVTGRDLNELTETRKGFPGTHIFQSDVSDPESIRAPFTNIDRQFPDLNILINNTGEMRLLELRDTVNSFTEHDPRDRHQSFRYHSDGTTISAA